MVVSPAGWRIEPWRYLRKAPYQRRTRSSAVWQLACISKNSVSIIAGKAGALYFVNQSIIGALLPIVAILLLGFFSGWQKDFTGDQATTLNRMVMLYALPLLLFGSTVSISGFTAGECATCSLSLQAWSAYLLLSFCLPRVPYFAAISAPAPCRRLPSAVRLDLRWRVRSRISIRSGKRFDSGHQRQPGDEL